MIKLSKSVPAIVVGTLIFFGCTSVKPKEGNPSNTKVVSGKGVHGRIIPPQNNAVNALPKAHIYRMNGDYAQNVPIQINASGQIISFPDPRDLSITSEPIKLSDGWWLDRRGVGLSTAFTKYTYQQYMALKEPPSIQQLKNSIIPEARITEIAVLPFTPEQAQKQIANVEALISDGLPGCEVTKGVVAPVAPTEAH